MGEWVECCVFLHHVFISFFLVFSFFRSFHSFFAECPVCFSIIELSTVVLESYSCRVLLCWTVTPVGYCCAGEVTPFGYCCAGEVTSGYCCAGEVSSGYCCAGEVTPLEYCYAGQLLL